MLEVPADSRLRDWLQQLPVKGPGLASLLLGALIAIDLGRTVLAVHTTVRAGSAPPIQPRPGPGVDTQRLVAAHLFGTAKPVGGDADARPPSVDLQLKGTIATGQADHGYAIIVGGNVSRLYRVGDQIGDATLTSVSTDYVILDRDGTPERLQLPRKPLAGQVLAARPAAVSHVPPKLLVDNLGRVVDKEPGVLDEILRMVDTYDKPGGKLRGFRVYPVKSGLALRRLGLDPGDLVTSINGAEFTDLEHGREAFNAIGTQGGASVTIDRQGHTMSVTLNVADAAEEIRNEATAGGAAVADIDGGTT